MEDASCHWKVAYCQSTPKLLTIVGVSASLDYTKINFVQGCISEFGGELTVVSTLHS